jgi:hypothetical protein
MGSGEMTKALDDHSKSAAVLRLAAIQYGKFQHNATTPELEALEKALFKAAREYAEKVNNKPPPKKLELWQTHAKQRYRVGWCWFEVDRKKVAHLFWNHGTVSYCDVSSRGLLSNPSDKTKRCTKCEKYFSGE